MDALHTQRGHAEFLHGRGIEFIMIAKDNQPRLFDATDAVTWEDIPVAFRTGEHGHGRHEIRTIQLAAAPPGLPFPHVSQVFLIERHTRRQVRKNGKATYIDSAVAELGVTSLTAAGSTPRRWPPTSATTGAWKTGLTGSGTLLMVRTDLVSDGPANPASWPRYVTSQPA